MSDFPTSFFQKTKELLTEFLSKDEAEEIVNRVIDEMFERKLVQRSHYSTGPDKYEDPEFIQLVQRELEPIMREAIQKWIKDNTDVVTKLITETIEVNLAGSVYRGFNRIFEESFTKLSCDMSAVLSKLRPL